MALKPDQIEEVKDAAAVLRSEDWRFFVRFQKRRAEKFQMKANEAVLKGDLTEAKVNLALMRETKNMAEEFSEEVKEQIKEINNQRGK